jgi:very-short-patch-repair endonuclease
MSRIEYRVARMLHKHNLPIISHNKVLHGTKYRPDFLVKKGRTVVVIEVDEYQHERYEQENERRREHAITECLTTQGQDVVILRFDPYKARLSKLMIDIVDIITRLLDDRPVDHILDRVRADVQGHVIRVY